MSHIEPVAARVGKNDRVRALLQPRHAVDLFYSMIRDTLRSVRALEALERWIGTDVASCSRD